MGFTECRDSALAAIVQLDDRCTTPSAVRHAEHRRSRDTVSDRRRRSHASSLAAIGLEHIRRLPDASELRRSQRSMHAVRAAIPRRSARRARVARCGPGDQSRIGRVASGPGSATAITSTSSAFAAPSASGARPAAARASGIHRARSCTRPTIRRPHAAPRRTLDQDAGVDGDDHGSRQHPVVQSSVADRRQSASSVAVISRSRESSVGSCPGVDFDVRLHDCELDDSRLNTDDVSEDRRDRVAAPGR